MRKLLDALIDQRSDGQFEYSVVVADNDPGQAARQVVAEFSSTSSVRVTYCFESQQNIALTRNRALQHADGDFIAFIDDDEYPAVDWLWHLHQTCMTCAVDGVLGPVNPYFEADPPEWLKKGRFFDRPAYETGYRVNWEQARTGNVLFRRSILSSVDIPFRAEFDTAGEDVDFFRRMMQNGFTFIWCNEAVAHELVPDARCTRSYLLRRALLRGSNFPKHPSHRVRNLTRSLIAVPCYTLALPILAVLGQHLFLKYLIKLFDHSSRLLAFAGLSAVRRRQT